VTGEAHVSDPQRLAQVNLRVDPTAAGAVGETLGVRLPTDPNTTTDTGALSALWLGPDEWLIVAAPGTGLDEATVRAALSDRPGSVVDVSAQRVDLVVTGPGARDVLAHGCSLDLHPSVVPVGRCAQTLVAQVQVVLWHRAPTEFHLLVRLSYVDHVTAWLRDAALG
jgi:sarcosine oxidase subunit gamma